MDIIDPHIHIFDLRDGHYYWLDDLSKSDKTVIAKTFCQDDLILSTGLSLRAVVHIEAGFNNDEPFLEIASVEHKAIELLASGVKCKTIGSIDLRDEASCFNDSVAKQMMFSSCIGFRHILNDQACQILRHKNTLGNLQFLASKNVVFELQVFLCEPQFIHMLIDILLQIPTLSVVVNHAGFPPLDLPQDAHWQDNETYKTWIKNIQALSKLPNVCVKCSGWEMTNREYSRQMLQAFVKEIAIHFGQHRVIFASNFPLLLYSQNYQEYWQMMQQLASDCGLEPRIVCFENAKRVYRFS